MKLTKTFAMLLLTTTLSVSVTAMSDQTENDIQATINGLETALNNKDTGILKTLYSDEAMLIAEESEILNDKAAIVSFWNNQLNEAKSRYHIDVIDFRVNDNIAYLSALWSATVVTDASNIEVMDGYLSNVLERQENGHWKIRIQNWN